MLTLTNGNICVDVSPEIGGRIVRFVDIRSGYDFLWRNAEVPLRRETPGSAYDPNFYGGIDELMPNDIPERIAGIECPDHGELWTSSFGVSDRSEATVSMRAMLPVFEFEVEKQIQLIGSKCVVHSRVTNLGSTDRPFLWKLHAALRIEPGDRIECDCANYSIADPDWSRRTQDGIWDQEVVPEFDGTTEFLYLHGLHCGTISWSRGNHRFSVEFDRGVFPYAWYFASYGGFDGHHVAILEPCNCMPISVNEAFRLGQCPILRQGASVATTYAYEGVSGED